MKINGFTLLELVIVLIIIAVLGLIFFGSDDATGAVRGERPIPAYLREHNAGFIYNDAGYVTILRTGSLEWTTPQEACDALKELDSSLKRVTLSTAAATNAETELVWNDDHTELSNLDGQTEADCK